MSLYTWFRDKFTKVIIVGKSELSHPGQSISFTYEDPRKQELAVLDILSHHGSLLSQEIDKIYPSGGRRLNDLFHKGYVDNIGNRRRMIYKINDRGYDLLLTR